MATSEYEYGTLYIDLYMQQYEMQKRETKASEHAERQTDETRQVRAASPAADETRPRAQYGT